MQPKDTETEEQDLGDGPNLLTNVSTKSSTLGIQDLNKLTEQQLVDAKASEKADAWETSQPEKPGIHSKCVIGSTEALTEATSPLSRVPEPGVAYRMAHMPQPAVTRNASNRGQEFIVIHLPVEEAETKGGSFAKGDAQNLSNICCCFLSISAQFFSNSPTRASQIVFMVFAIGVVIFTPPRWTAMGAIANVGMLGMAWDQGMSVFVILCAAVCVVHVPRWVKNVWGKMSPVVHPALRD